MLARLRASGPQLLEEGGILRYPIDHPEGRRVRGDLAEERLLVAHRAQVRQAVPSIGEHHRQVADDAAGVVT